MTDIGPHLERLGLEQYHDAFVAEGFDTWETILDVQENDLDALGVKLGHRRKLQRAIAEFRGFSSDRPLGSPSQEGPLESARSSEGGFQSGSLKESPVPTAPEQKRKYRRHPKPDENAPEKPPSAYVIFSNKIREEVKGDNLSFTEIARLVGERWQKLEPIQKEPFEGQATALKENYHAQLAAYKKTDAYRDYLQYLADFKAKHGQTGESKRPKLEFQSSSSASGHGQDVETVLQLSVHSRGGSIGSMSAASLGTAHTSPAGIALPPPVSSLPNLNTSINRQLVVGGRGSTPPLSHLPPVPGLPREFSSQSSVSEESAATRSEQLDPLPRAATLSINTPPTVTPPLPSASSISGKSEHGNSSDSVPWSQRQPHSGQAFLGPPSSSLSGHIGMPLVPPGVADSWRERTGDPGRHSFQSSSSHAYSQSGSVPISQLLGMEHGSEYSQRTLPPPRRLPSVPGLQPAGLPTLSNPSLGPQAGGVEIIPGHSSQSRTPFNRTENEAASTLAELARRQSKQGQSNSPDHAQPR